MTDRKLNLSLLASLALCTAGAQAASPGQKTKKGTPENRT